MNIWDVVGAIASVVCAFSCFSLVKVIILATSVSADGTAGYFIVLGMITSSAVFSGLVAYLCLDK